MAKKKAAKKKAKKKVAKKKKQFSVKVVTVPDFATVKLSDGVMEL